MHRDCQYIGYWVWTVRYAQVLGGDTVRLKECIIVQQKNKCIYRSTNLVTVFSKCPSIIVTKIWKFISLVICFTVFDAVKRLCRKRHYSLILGPEIKLSCFGSAVHDYNESAKISGEYCLMTCWCRKICTLAM